MCYKNTKFTKYVKNKKLYGDLEVIKQMLTQ